MSAAHRWRASLDYGFWGPPAILVAEIEAEETGYVRLERKT
jgi:hypothetical protein